MDIFSTIVGVAQAGEYAWSLYSLIKDARKVDENVNSIAMEVEGFGKTCDMIHAELERIVDDFNRYTGDPNGPGTAPFENFWKCINSQLNGCNTIAKRLTEVIVPLKKSRGGFVRDVYRQLQLRFSETEIINMRSQMHSHSTTLSIALNALSMRIQYLSLRRIDAKFQTRMETLEANVLDAIEIWASSMQAVLDQRCPSLPQPIAGLEVPDPNESLIPQPKHGDARTLPSSVHDGFARLCRVAESYKNGGFDFTHEDEDKVYILGFAEEVLSEGGRTPEQSTNEQLVVLDDQPGRLDSNSPTVDVEKWIELQPPEVRHEWVQAPPTLPQSANSMSDNRFCPIEPTLDSSLESDESDDETVELARWTLRAAQQAYNDTSWAEAYEHFKTGVQLLQQRSQKRQHASDLWSHRYKLAVCAFHSQAHNVAEGALCSFAAAEADDDDQRLLQCKAGLLLAKVHARQGRLELAQRTCRTARRGMQRLKGLEDDDVYDALALQSSLYTMSGSEFAARNAKVCSNQIPEESRDECMRNHQDLLTSMKHERTDLCQPFVEDEVSGPSTDPDGKGQRAQESWAQKKPMLEARATNEPRTEEEVPKAMSIFPNSIIGSNGKDIDTINTSIDADPATTPRIDSAPARNSTSLTSDPSEHIGFSKDLRNMYEYYINTLAAGSKQPTREKDTSVVETRQTKQYDQQAVEPASSKKFAPTLQLRTALSKCLHRVSAIGSKKNQRLGQVAAAPKEADRTSTIVDIEDDSLKPLPLSPRKIVQTPSKIDPVNCSSPLSAISLTRGVSVRDKRRPQDRVEPTQLLSDTSAPELSRATIQEWLDELETQPWGHIQRSVVAGHDLALCSPEFYQNKKRFLRTSTSHLAALFGNVEYCRTPEFAREQYLAYAVPAKYTYAKQPVRPLDLAMATARSDIVSLAYNTKWTYLDARMGGEIWHAAPAYLFHSAWLRLTRTDPQRVLEVLDMILFSKTLFSVDAKLNSDGWTLLHFAVSRPQEHLDLRLATSRWLLYHANAAMTASTNDGDSPLHLAAGTNDTAETVNLLLVKASQDKMAFYSYHPNKAGRTALDLAIENRVRSRRKVGLDVIKALLKANANALRNSLRLDPAMTVALRDGDDDLADLLESYAEGLRDRVLPDLSGVSSCLQDNECPDDVGAGQEISLFTVTKG